MIKKWLDNKINNKKKIYQIIYHMFVIFFSVFICSNGYNVRTFIEIVYNIINFREIINL